MIQSKMRSINKVNLLNYNQNDSDRLLKFYYGLLVKSLY